MAALIRIDELARELRLQRRWLSAETKAGRIPCLKAGGDILYNPEAVQNALAERAATERVQPEGERGADSCQGSHDYRTP